MTIRGLLLAAAFVAAGATGAYAQETKLFQDFRPGSDAAINVEADKLEVSEKADERISMFSGNVTVSRGATVLKASAITIHSDLGAPQSGKEAFNLIEAEGRVTVTDSGSRATSDGATFNMKTQIATMTGNVVLAQGSNVLSGEKLTVDLNSGTARVEQTPGGRIKGVFTPNAPNVAPGE